MSDRRNRQPGHPWNKDRPRRPAPNREAIEPSRTSLAAVAEIEQVSSLADLAATKAAVKRW